MEAIERMPAEVFPPGEFLQEELEARAWSQADLSYILGKPAKAINEIILGKRQITPEMARLLGQALGTSPAVWLNLESAYQLNRAERSKPLTDEVARRSELYGKYPVREMARRGWIELTENVDVLEKQLVDFHSPPFPYAARRREDEAKTPLQQAWVHRTRNLARTMQVERFSEDRLGEALTELKPLLNAVEEIRRVPEILRRAGVRFLVVEPLRGSKIDGVCCWLDARSPVVAVSLRYDRIDHFWFTLMHELHHVKLGHGKERAILDTLDTGVMGNEDASSEERLADDGAMDFLVPQREMEGFIARVRPQFSSSQIRGFSERMGVHMGIVVGQLQRRGEIGYSQHRKALVSVRRILARTAAYDGGDMAR